MGRGRGRLRRIAGSGGGRLKEAVQGELPVAGAGRSWGSLLLLQPQRCQAAAAAVHGLHCRQAHHAPHSGMNARRGAGEPEAGGGEGGLGLHCCSPSLEKL